MANYKPTVAFFGATGGCTNAALVLALKDGYQCTALARTPSKLTALLLSKGVPQETLSANLHITKGDIKNIPTTKAALMLDGTVVDMIISGIGMIMGRNTDTTVCEATARSLVTALSELKPAKPPFITVISSTGISNGPRDVPYAVWPFYHFLLSVPHKDKRVMEGIIVDAATNGHEKHRLVSGYTILRPSFLNSGKASEKHITRYGVEEKPAIGYTISRDGVGAWIFAEIIEEGGKKWAGEAVTLTH